MIPDFSFFKKKEIIPLFSKGSKFLFKSRSIKEKIDYGKKYQLGGQDNYFENLSRGAFRRGQEFRGRTLNFLLKHAIVADQIFKKVSFGKKIAVLDIGCNSGFLRRILESNLEKENIIYVGLDLSRNKLEEAVLGEKSLKSGALGDKIASAYVWHDAVKPLPFQASSFDFVVSFQMIKYLKKAETKFLLKEISRVSRKGAGFFLSSDPFFEKKEKKSALEERERLKNNGYASFWGQKELIEDLKKIGFDSIFVYGSGANMARITEIADSDQKREVQRLAKIMPVEFVESFFGFCIPGASRERVFFMTKTKNERKQT